MLREECRLPYGVIQRYLKWRYRLCLSVGELVALVRGVARLGQEEYNQLQQEILASPVVYGDETGWREAGRNGYLRTLRNPDVTFVRPPGHWWLVSEGFSLSTANSGYRDVGLPATLYHRTDSLLILGRLKWVQLRSFSNPEVRYFLRRGSRGSKVVAEVLGDEFDRVLVSDFYGAYNVHQGLHQRCWTHLLRDIGFASINHPAPEFPILLHYSGPETRSRATV